MRRSVEVTDVRDETTYRLSVRARRRRFIDAEHDVAVLPRIQLPFELHRTGVALISKALIKRAADVQPRYRAIGVILDVCGNTEAVRLCDGAAYRYGDRQTLGIAGTRRKYDREYWERSFH